MEIFCFLFCELLFFVCEKSSFNKPQSALSLCRFKNRAPLLGDDDDQQIFPEILTELRDHIRGGVSEPISLSRVAAEKQ